eukprot:358231-Chlamydomonas_euryale.AAC.1
MEPLPCLLYFTCSPKEGRHSLCLLPPQVSACCALICSVGRSADDSDERGSLPGDCMHHSPT